MKNTHALSSKKSWSRRASVAGVAAMAIVVGGFAVQANADSAFAPYHEGDNAMPLSVTEGLVFFKNADLGWSVNVPIADVHSLAYTVAAGADTLGSDVATHAAYAPSFQLVVLADRDGFEQKYGRLVWEPYMQGTDLDPATGEYTNLQDGLWWTSKIESGEGSQASPQPLSFFESDGGAGWDNVNVLAIDVHQGTTSEVTSVVTKVNYNGTDVPLGNADTTPFDQGDIDAATGPLNATIDGLTADNDGLNATIDDLTADKALLTQQLAASQAALAAATGPLGTQIHDLSVLLTNTQSDFLAYKANHHTADGSSIGESRALLSVKPVHAHKVGVKLTGSIAKATAVKYQWYLSGKAVTGATKSTYTVPATAKGKSVSVKVTGTYKNIVFAVHSNTLAAK